MMTDTGRQTLPQGCPTDGRGTETVHAAALDLSKMQVGDVVLYGGRGVCAVEDIRSETIFRGGETKEYYILASLFAKGEFTYIPTDNAQLTARLYPVLTREEIEALLERMDGAAPLWVEREEERKIRFSDILISGDRFALMRMLRALRLHQERQQQRGRKLHLADERVFRDGEKLLEEEFSHVLKIPREEVPPYIRAHLA